MAKSRTQPKLEYPTRGAKIGRGDMDRSCAWWAWCWPRWHIEEDWNCRTLSLLENFLENSCVLIIRHLGCTFWRWYPRLIHNYVLHSDGVECFSGLILVCIFVSNGYQIALKSAFLICRASTFADVSSVLCKKKSAAHRSPTQGIIIYELAPAG